MPDSSIAVLTIKDLRSFEFVIPSFQRGYRWTSQQVEELLTDIDEFNPREIENSNEKTWYCLQPIVVKKENEKRWHVIDGQQRLTTIFLILHYLNQRYREDSRHQLFKLEYETRAGSSEYLRTELGESEEDYSNIDYFHISRAYQTIKKWFHEHESELDFERKFNVNTKVIWYETSENDDSIDIFTRLNSGKIPLTNAELIKALFLNSSNFLRVDIEKLRLQQLEIASEWDRMEYTLQDDSFWYFLNQKGNDVTTRIEFIFDLICDQSTIKQSTFHFFYQKFKVKTKEEITKNWQEVKKYFQILEEWFNDRELYHKVGFLITIGKDIKDILKEKKDKSKVDFLFWIKQEIAAKFQNINLEEVEYGKDVVRNVLLLHNIQTMLNNKNETNRFPFDRYKKEHWDVEHIHARASEVRVKKEGQVEWLRNNFIKTEGHSDEDSNQQIEQICKTGNVIEEEGFSILIDYVLGEHDNSLQNLCLLDRGTNRSYKNDSFKLKRKKVIEREIDGAFIPICTKNVFLKYYSSTVVDLEVWNENDRVSYFNSIRTVLSDYLS